LLRAVSGIVINRSIGQIAIPTMSMAYGHKAPDHKATQPMMENIRVWAASGFRI
jgi:hypothetical protein